MIARVKYVQTCARGCLYHTHIYINRSRDGIQIACGSMRQYMQRTESSKFYMACDLACIVPCHRFLRAMIISITDLRAVALALKIQQ